MNTRMLALQAANVGMGLSSNRKNRVLRAPATNSSWFAVQVMGRPQADIDAVLRSACRLRVKT